MQNLTAKNSMISRLLSFAAIVFMAGCSSGAPTVGSVKANPLFSEPLVRSEDKLVPRDQATIIFVRQGSKSASGTQEPVNVYVNGRFLASLLPGGFIEHRNCPGSVEVAAVFDDARIRHLGKNGHEVTVPLEAGRTYYFKVNANGTDSEVKLEPVSADEVFLGEYRRQVHTLPRAPECINAAPAAIAPAAAPVGPATQTAMAPALTAHASARLESWRAAWERGDFAAYTDFYAPGFKGTFKSHQEWLKSRRSRLMNRNKQIAVKDPVVNSSGDAVATDFMQIYHSAKYDDNGQKVLLWKDFGGELKIVEEYFTTKK